MGYRHIEPDVDTKKYVSVASLGVQQTHSFIYQTIFIEHPKLQLFFRGELYIFFNWGI